VLVALLDVRVCPVAPRSVGGGEWKLRKPHPIRSIL
jgi:hypothetical protein